MNLFAITSLLLFLACYSLALLIFVFAKQKLHTYWAFFNLAVGTYGLGMFLAGITKNYDLAFFYWKIAYFGVGSISMFFYLVVSEFCNLNNQRSRNFVFFHGLFFSVLAIATNVVVSSLRFVFNQFYLPIAGFWWNLLFLIWVLIVIKAFIRLYKYIKSIQGLKAIQGRYLFYGMLLGFLSGASTAVTTWGINIYPAWHFFICIYAGICTYAVFKYQLMDIKVAVTRLGVFVIVYSIVLGLPFWIGWKMYGWGHWLLPTSIGTFLASLGPFIYLFFQRRAEAQLLQEERRIQDVLTKASVGMSSVRDLEKLLKLIVNVLGKSLGLEFTALYLFEPGNNEYVLKVADPPVNEAIILKQNDLLIRRLCDKRSPLQLEEMDYLLDHKKENTSDIKEIIVTMQKLNATAIIPAVKEDNVLTFVVLGKRNKKEGYSQELLDVLTVVGNQIALAVENAIFYEESGKDWTERAHESRLRTMGAMGTGIAHQIRNRFNAISSQCLLLQEILSGFDATKSTPQEFYDLRDEYNNTMERIFKDIQQGEEIVEAIKNYSKDTEAKPQMVELGEVVTGAMRLLKLSRKIVNFTLVENYPPGVVLWTNLSMLQDMFYNLFDNSNDAVISKQELIKDGKLKNKNEDFKVIVSANPNSKMCEILIEDNGMGIKKEHLEEGVGVNVMYFTTKGATKGTGMGLALMRQFVKYNGGVMKIESEYTQWTRITITLPLATEAQIKQSGKNGGHS